jgi:hypothetical protein
MDTEALLLTLTAKKPAKEAIDNELAGLHELTGKNPEIKAPLKNISGNLDNVKLNHNLSEKEIDDNIALVLKKIHQQINVPETHRKDS